MTFGVGLSPLPDPGMPAGHEPAGGVPDHDGLVCLPHAGRRARFIREGRYSVRAALGLALGGIPGVLLAAYVVKSLPDLWLRWLVVAVVLYTAALMLLSARRRHRASSSAQPVWRRSASTLPKRWISAIVL